MVKRPLESHRATRSASSQTSFVNDSVHSAGFVKTVQLGQRCSGHQYYSLRLEDYAWMSIKRPLEQRGVDFCAVRSFRADRVKKQREMFV
ncbi:hypothetical protein QQF64_013073 [Cirrhinus molitorella]|uniref:Uncharacterized protein n=1 Tax=Cirrhinus molitorella TaxID=172907 RepID=A0ABR3LTS6_9TELE